MDSEDRIRVAIVALIAVTIMTLAGSLAVYHISIDTAAIAKGLCSGTVPGSNMVVWTTCPLAK